MTLPSEAESRRHPDADTPHLSGPVPDRRGGARCLAAVLGTLALGMAMVSVLGPVGLGVLQYRTSATTLNQLLGSDAAVLVLIVPLTVAAAVLVTRGHRAGPVLGSGVGVFALYTYAQVIVGQEYLRLPGNIEYWFPLLLAVFVLAEAATVLSWLATPPDLPRASPRVERTAAVVLLAVAVFLVFGQHGRSLLLAWQDPWALTEYASSPTPFWLVKLMDLGIIVPAAIATGLGLLAGARWARRLMYPLLTGYTCLAVSVAAMAVVMTLKDDPDASPALAAGFLVFALVFVVLAVALYRPLIRSGRRPPDRTATEEASTGRDVDRS